MTDSNYYGIVTQIHWSSSGGIAIKAEESAAPSAAEASTTDAPSAQASTTEPKKEEAAAAAEPSMSTPAKAGEAATANGVMPLVDRIWKELLDNKAIHKACQVMRDISRLL